MSVVQDLLNLLVCANIVCIMMYYIYCRNRMKLVLKFDLIFWSEWCCC